MMMIYEQKNIVDSGLGLKALSRDSLRVVGIRRVLGRLVLFCKSSQKVINLVAQSIVRLC